MMDNDIKLYSLYILFEMFIYNENLYPIESYT